MMHPTAFNCRWCQGYSRRHRNIHTCTILIIINLVSYLIYLCRWPFFFLHYLFYNSNSFLSFSLSFTLFPTVSLYKTTTLLTSSKNGTITMLWQGGAKERAMDSRGRSEALGIYWRTRPRKLACFASKSW